MDVGNSTAAASAGARLLRQTLDMVEDTAAQLIESVPEPSRPAAGSAPAERLGQTVDVKA